MAISTHIHVRTRRSLRLAGGVTGQPLDQRSKLSHAFIKGPDRRFDICFRMADADIVLALTFQNAAFAHAGIVLRGLSPDHQGRSDNRPLPGW